MAFLKDSSTDYCVEFSRYTIKNLLFFVAENSKKHEYICKEFHTIFNPELNKFF